MIDYFKEHLSGNFFVENAEMDCHIETDRSPNTYKNDDHIMMHFLRS